jgi:hypothetical protein
VLDNTTVAFRAKLSASLTMKIQDQELHLLIDSEVDRVPHHLGVFMLWQGSHCVHVDEGILRTTLLVARAHFPSATHISLVKNSHGNDRFQIVEKLRVLHGLSGKPLIGF